MGTSRTWKFGVDCSCLINKKGRTFFVRPSITGLCRLFLQHFQKVFAEFGYFGCNHRLTIRLIWIAGKVFLVIILGYIIVAESAYFGHNRMIPYFLLIQFPDQSFSGLFLFGGMIKDGRTILCACIRSLTIKGGGVVDREEDVQQVAIRKH